MALLEIRNITRRFGDFTAVDDVSLDIEAGEFFCLLGRPDAARPRCCGWSRDSTCPTAAASGWTGAT
jgi:ABC-type uncharacterized transport system ATPase subunit